MATKAQEWARERNTAKWRLTGVSTTLANLIRFSPLTPGEAATLESALDKIDIVVDYWKGMNPLSKNAYLKAKRK